jgi:TrmH family RNA methyltransferase
MAKRSAVDMGSQAFYHFRLTIVKLISSRHNQLFKRIRDAIRDPDREIVLEGRKHVEDALAAGWRPAALVTRGEGREDAVPFTPELFDALADTRAPQDLIGLFERPRHDPAEILRSAAPVVVLDGVQDPGNVGTIIRLAAAFDCAGVLLLPGSADPYAPKAIRASAGAVLNVPVATVELDTVIAAARPLLAAAGSGRELQEVPANAIFVFGNEGNGVSAEVREVATKIRIAMSSRVESLNVAAAAAILLSRAYEGRRR